MYAPLGPLLRQQRILKCNNPGNQVHILLLQTLYQLRQVRNIADRCLQLFHHGLLHLISHNSLIVFDINYHGIQLAGRRQLLQLTHTLMAGNGTRYIDSFHRPGRHPLRFRLLFFFRNFRLLLYWFFAWCFFFLHILNRRHFRILRLGTAGQTQNKTDTCQTAPLFSHAVPPKPQANLLRPSGFNIRISRKSLPCRHPAPGIQSAAFPP